MNGNEWIFLCLFKSSFQFNSPVKSSFYYYKSVFFISGQNINDFEKVLRTIRELWYTPQNNDSITDVQYLHNYYSFIQRWVQCHVSSNHSDKRWQLLLFINKIIRKRNRRENATSKKYPHCNHQRPNCALVSQKRFHEYLVSFKTKYKKNRF